MMQIGMIVGLARKLALHSPGVKTEVLDQSEPVDIDMHLFQKFTSAGMIFCCSVVNPPNRLWAQQPDSQPLTLTAALAYAHEHSPRLAASKQGVETQQAGIKTAEAQRLPRLDVRAAFAAQIC